MFARVLKIVAVNVLVLLGAAILLELFFGLWFSKDPLDALDIQRNVSVRVDPSPLYPGGRPFEFAKNRWGFRGGDIDPAAIDILTMGGSTTNQLYLPEDQTWQAVMARRLDALGHPAVVANAGVDGQSSFGVLFDMQDWMPNVPGLKPKIILSYIGLNDTTIGFGSSDKLRYSGKLKWLRAHSALLRMGRIVDGMIRARAARLTHEPIDYAHAAWTDRPNYPDNAAARPQANAEEYAKRIEALADAIESFGAKPVFVTQSRGDSLWRDGKLVGLPSDEGLNALDEARLLAAFNQAALAVCVRRHLTCLDLASDLHFADGDFYDRVHNTPQGAAKIGTYLADKLNEGIWPVPSASR